MSGSGAEMHAARDGEYVVDVGNTMPRFARSLSVESISQITALTVSDFDSHGVCNIIYADCARNP
jgi:hypothetical protein